MVSLATLEIIGGFACPFPGHRTSATEAKTSRRSQKLGAQVTRLGVHAETFRSNCMGVWHWVWCGFMRLTFAAMWHDISLMRLCFPTFETVRPVFLEIAALICDGSDDHFFSWPMLGNQFVSPSNQLNRLLWAVVEPCWSQSTSFSYYLRSAY